MLEEDGVRSARPHLQTVGRERARALDGEEGVARDEGLLQRRGERRGDVRRGERSPVRELQPLLELKGESEALDKLDRLLATVERRLASKLL